MRPDFRAIMDSIPDAPRPPEMDRLWGYPIAGALENVILAYSGNKPLDERQQANIWAAFSGLDSDERRIARSIHLTSILKCESPIEIAILPWLIGADFSPFRTRPVPVIAVGDSRDDADIVIFPQFERTRYRFDFLVVGFVAERPVRVAVECDGAEFHDAEKDKIRDAAALSAGIPTVRASGSEIFRDPGFFIKRIASTVGAMADRMRVDHT